METSTSAWLTESKAYPFVLKAGPKPQPGEGEVLIRNAAVAIEVGAGVTRFKRGQPVIAHCNSLLTQNPANSAFQHYTILTEKLVAEIPAELGFEQAVVLPLAITTACAGLYGSEYLNLPLPSLASEKKKKTGQTILIWGGVSSVGATAIQLASCSGLQVITTASTANHDFVKSLGADAVFDYKSPTVVDAIAKAVLDTDLVGVYDAIGEAPSFAAITALADQLQRPLNTAAVLPCDQPTPRCIPKYVRAVSIIEQPDEHIAQWIWGQFLPQALTSGQFQAKPDLYIVGNGLKDVQYGLDVQKKGVSAKKGVISL
ncbi:zinc-binding alcohol dehydrogenase family protein [Aspergillus ibericus CBS 121593]|uniref:Zinc-binding oxidoreductase CipB n=1 Tax=Aspergillus ibericus CBS 121593 TaxID=1448316 RepID=A0A395GRP2_9EURO|nr:zinc-binding oxidoreductase CipB [Aspergillus ibericus CBS 121593]RAK98076.1 zinc-binding oxidoreductase CipB [Aspergillus ibericus CBS 121593]